jgi:hypothetical protein
MLSNFNVGGQPLFQSFLIGQPQFLQTVAHKDLKQLQQRIIASYKLESMSRKETEEYVEHRLAAVGWTGNPHFDESAHDAIFEEARGVPRLINTLANRVMLFASLEEVSDIDGEMVATVIADLESENQASRAGAQASGSGDSVGVSAGSGGGGVDDERVQRLERAMAAIIKRLQSAEDKLGEHDEAIHEMIDLAMSAYTSEESDEDARESREREEDDILQLHAL